MSGFGKAKTHVPNPDARKGTIAIGSAFHFVLPLVIAKRLTHTIAIAHSVHDDTCTALIVNEKVSVSYGQSVVGMW